MFIITDKARPKGGGRQKVTVGIMKDKESKLEETEAAHTLGGAIKYASIHQSRWFRESL